MTGINQIFDRIEFFDSYQFTTSLYISIHWCELI